MRTRHCIGPEDDFESGSFHGVTDNIVIEGQGAFHRSEAFFGVTGCAEEPLLVDEIILDHKTSLRIEVCAMFGHQFQSIVVRQCAVLDLGATCERGRAHGIFVSMDECSYPLFVRLVASSIELIL